MLRLSFFSVPSLRSIMYAHLGLTVLEYDNGSFTALSSQHFLAWFYAIFVLLMLVLMFTNHTKYT